MPVKKLKEFLDSRRVRYESISHPQTYTAQRTAQMTHIRGKEMAKTVVVKLDGKQAMVVVAADKHVSLDKVKAAAGAHAAEVASEQDFTTWFPECEVGAMPPFGNLYGMQVFVDADLAEDEEIAFNAGSHTEVIRLAYSDFEALVKPVRGVFAI